MSLTDAVYIAYYFSLSALIIPVITGLITWKALPKNFKVFSVGLFVIFLILLFSSLTPYLKIKNNLLLNYITFSFDCILYSWIFSNALNKKTLKNYIWIGCTLIVLLSIIEVTTTSWGKSLSVYASAFKSIFIIVLIVTFLTKLIRYSKISKFSDIPLFWVACIKLFVAMFSLISETFQGFMMKNGMENALYLSIIATFIAQAICDLLYAVPIWKASNQASHISNIKI